MAVTEVFARRATLRRSVRLLSSFRYEQAEPPRFYGPLAVDTVHLVSDLWQGIHGERPLGRRVLDVGGGPGYFSLFDLPGVGNRCGGGAAEFKAHGKDGVDRGLWIL